MKCELCGKRCKGDLCADCEAEIDERVREIRKNPPKFRVSEQEAREIREDVERNCP